MSLRNYDNSNSPRQITVINDGALSQTQLATGERIVVLGFCNNPLLPVQELIPSTLGALDTNSLLSASYNIDDAGNPYPSELSVALEELFRSGSTNVQIINLGKSDRMIDLTSRMARERYIALENAYDSLVDLSIDRIVAVNVVAGKKGDGLYNANTDSTITAGQGLEVVYDLEAWNAAASTLKDLSTVEGYVKIVDEAYEKAPTAGGEDLVYQLAAICYKITSNGTMCTGAFRTLTAVELKYMQKINMAVAGDTVYYSGAPFTGIAANTWAISKGYNDVAAGGVDYVANPKDAEDVLLDIEANASMAVPTTGGLKAIFKETSSQTFAGTAVSALEEIAWQVYYGAPSASQMQRFFRFLNSFGTNVDTALKQTGVSILEYLDQDTVTSANGEVPDNFLMFATEDSEKPTSYLDTDILKDENLRNVDIGHFLDKVIANSSFTATFPGTSLTPKTFTFASGIGQVTGWYNVLPNDTATTRQATGVVGPLGIVSSKAASDLTRNGYQLFLSQDGAYVFNRDITSGLFINDNARTDFVNRMTTRIMKQALRVAYVEGKLLLGKLDSSRAREGLKQKLEQEFARWAHPEDGRLRRPATVEVFSNGIGAVIGRLTIVLGLAIANEILEIRTVASVEQ